MQIHKFTVNSISEYKPAPDEYQKPADLSIKDNLIYKGKYVIGVGSPHAGGLCLAYRFDNAGTNLNNVKY